MNVVLMTLKVDLSLKALLAAVNDAAEWLVVGMFSLVSDSERQSERCKKCWASCLA